MAAPRTKVVEKEVSEVEGVVVKQEVRSEIKPEVLKSDKESALTLIKDILVLSLTPDDGLSKAERKEKGEKLLNLVEKLKSI